ncbi:MAG: acyl carrier protein [Fimbriimonadaceae bacterium]
MSTDFEDWAYREVIAIVARILKVSPHSISPRDRLADLSFDDLEMVEFVMEFEEHFPMKVLPESVDTVADLIEFVRRSLE